MEIPFTYWMPSGGSENSFIVILTGILLLLSVIVFIRAKYDILYPPFIVCSSFTLCCALDALYTTAWSLPMHFNTSVIILAMVLCFIFGSELAGAGFSPEPETGGPPAGSSQMDIPTSLFFVIFGILILFLVQNYYEFLDIAGQVTSSTNFSDMLFPVTDGIAHNKVHFSRLFSYRLLFAKGIAYMSVLLLWHEIFSARYLRCGYWISLIALYCGFVVLTAGRQQFLYLALFMLVSFLLFSRRRRYEKNLGSNQNNFAIKEAITVGIAFVGFLIFFMGLGVASGKVTLGMGMFRALAHYAGTNIAAFDVFINEMNIPINQYIGANTLVAAQSFFKLIGGGPGNFGGYITDFTYFGDSTANVSTNVYTAFYRYIIDYGYIGCALIMFLFGYGFTAFYRYLLAKKMPDWMILIYGAIVYPIFLFCREERFMNEVLTIQTAVLLVFLFVLYRICLSFGGKKGRLL